MKHLVQLLTTVLLLAPSSLWCQTRLVVDRSPSATADRVVRLARTDGRGFLGDHFQIGKPGEVWIVDHVRTWASAENGSIPSAKIADVFRRVSLYGGIEAPEPKADTPAQPECDCHNLLAIKSADIPIPPLISDVQIGNDIDGGWQQLDFQNLQWSIPGGVPIHFGVMGVPESEAYTLYSRASVIDGVHSIRAFDEKGKLEGRHETTNTALGDSMGINVQVWAHKMARVEFRLGKFQIEVVLFSDPSLDAASVDPSSLRFGPRQAVAIGNRLETVQGRVVLFAQFLPQDAGILASTVNACLTGRQKDGVPFEGCDLLKGK